MKQLHFTRIGKLHVAFHGRERLVIHEIGAAFRAEVHERFAAKGRSLTASADFSTKAAAIDWLSRGALPFDTQSTGRQV